MALFAPIPLPNPNSNEAFKDVMEYLETIRDRQGRALQAKNSLEQNQKQFDVSSAFDREKMLLQNQMEKAKLAELANYHRQKLDKESGLPQLSAQERSEAMKLLESGRSLKSILKKAKGVSSLLENNPKLTGYRAGFNSLLNKPGKETSAFIEKTGNLQSAIGRLASQRGGAQVLKWAEKIKPSVWKDILSNQGMTNSILEDTHADFSEVKDEYEALTGKPFPVNLADLAAKAENEAETETPKTTQWVVKDGKLVRK